MTQLTSILDQFHEDLDRTSDLLELIKYFRAFGGSSVPTGVGDGSVPWDEAIELARIGQTVRTDLPILSGSILLYLCGRFENFVREVVIAIGDGYASKATAWEDLPSAVRDEIFRRTLEVARSPSKYNFETADGHRLIRVLADSLGPPTTAAVTIEPRLLAITDTNMNARTMDEVFKRLGIDRLWRELGKQAPLKSYLGEPEDGQCASAASAKIDALMKERNGLAHPTAATTFPGPDQVHDAVEFLRVLSRVTVDLAAIPR